MKLHTGSSKYVMESKEDKDLRMKASREERAAKLEILESSYGYEGAGEEDRVGWLVNFSSTSVTRNNKVHSAVKCYFIAEDSTNFKAFVYFSPYFYLYARHPRSLTEISNALQRQFREQIEKIEVIGKQDLDLKNHLSGKMRHVLKVSCYNVQDLMEVRNYVRPYASRTGGASGTSQSAFADNSRNSSDCLNDIESIREYDVQYHERFAIDTGTRCGLWYDVSTTTKGSTLRKREDLIRWAQPTICAFDIETTKLPLRFPNAEYDQVFMISYMINGKGFLIVNREVVGSDIDDFDYCPKKDIGGSFAIINEPDELALLCYFFNHMKKVKPHIYVTYNGDFFDWPFIEKRAAIHGINMYDELGFYTHQRTGECLSQFAIHMDAFYWVKRDSYLPQGSQGLKAVTKAKLGYNPVEVDPEDMVRFAYEHPQRMASYSVSDAVATYFLYHKYVHPFIFSLGTIIPMPPDQVLRKGSGTLCESLLMVQAFDANIIAPNKFQSQDEKFHDGRLLQSETYIGGHVEALESGVFRADIDIPFNNDPSAYQELIDRVEEDLKYTITVENKVEMEDVTNYEEVRDDIIDKLTYLRDNPRCTQRPLIYHLDVAAMYPNIILTNRLQPCSTVTEEDCAACDFNTPDKKCLREMEWKWRGESFAGTSSEYQLIKNQAETESFPSASRNGRMTSFLNLKKEEKLEVLKNRFKKYCQKVYGRVLNKPVAQPRIAGICMRENNFYVNTVQSFRDRRYEYKALNKKWKGKLGEAEKAGRIQSVKEAQDMVILYDSLQLAHKCILNSFYGYVMRKGARWYSMEMAGVVTLTGAVIIQNACKLIERIGRPLELDTDGIWCCLPRTFPEEYKFETSGKPVFLSYPCSILNNMVAKNNTNDQYQSLVDPETKKYDISSRMTIEFEVDGPYKAMILPAALAEGKSIKKRYAVFDFKGRLVELKGFEMKRRGELKLVKLFQEEIFSRFLDGTTLEECYACVASVANRWLDVLDTRGIDLTEEELLDLISDSTNMSKSIEEYDGKRSTAITTANRLSQFLGGDVLNTGGGLNCTFVIGKKPEGLPVSERAIPITIFKADLKVRRRYLSMWCRDSFNGQDVISVRDVLDWEYYKERLGKAIQKIITIPAAMQKVSNPVERVKHPEWLQKTIMRRNDKYKQYSMTMFTTKKTGQEKTKKNIFLIGTEDQKMAKDDGAMGEADDARPQEVSEMEVDGEEKGAGERERDEKESNQSDSPVSVLQGIQSRHMTKEEYTNWLRARKAYWKQLLVKRRMERKMGSITLANKKARNVGEFFRRQQKNAIGSFWHIIHLNSTEDPQTLQAWVFVQGAGMYSIPLRIPKSYGTSISAIDLATLNIGCVAEVVQKDAFVKGRKLADGVGLDELRMTAQCPYVFSFGGDFRKVFVYTSGAGERAMMSLVFGKEAVVIVVKTQRSPRELAENTLVRLLKQAGREATDGGEVSFRIEYVRTMEAAGKVANAEIVNFRNSSGTGALVSCYEGSLGMGELTRLVPVLKALPNLRRGHSSFEYPLMQWQTYAAQVFVERMVSFDAWWSERGSLSQYSHIPVGNLSASDVNLQIADVFFARSLERATKEAPWWGGDAESLALGEELSPQFHVANPGFYAGVVAKFKVYHLPVNALHAVDEGDKGEDVLRVLKTLVSRWFADATSNSSANADALLINFYRWITDATSSMYSHKVHQLMRVLVHNSVSALVREIEKHNVKVIYASKDDLILSLPKQDKASAEAFVQALKTIVRKSESFPLLQLQEESWFQQFSFIDQFNYSGLQLSGAPASESQTEGSHGVFLKYDMAHYLPKVLNQAFEGIVAEYVLKLSNSDLRVIQTQELWMDVDQEEGKRDFALSRYVTDELSDKVLRIVRDMEVDDVADMDSFPRSAAYGDDANVLLSFVRILTSVLGLNTQIKEEVSILRKNLHRAIQCNEYGTLSGRELPIFSLVVPDLILPKWNESRDVDLLRDTILAAYLKDHPSDKSHVEEQVIAFFQNRLSQYYMQDLKCKRTNQVHERRLCNHSSFGGNLVLSKGAEDFKTIMRDFVSVAEFYDFGLLADQLSWLG